MMNASSRKCPICGKNTGEKTMPFCSIRCAHLDLGKWLGEGYRVPLDEKDDPCGSLPNQEIDTEIG